MQQAKQLRPSAHPRPSSITSLVSCSASLCLKSLTVLGEFIVNIVLKITH